MSILLERAEALLTAERFETAEELLREALHRAEQGDHQEMKELVGILRGLTRAMGAVACGATGRDAEVLALERRALALAESENPRRHRVISRLYQGTSLSLVNLGRYDEAALAARRAVELEDEICNDGPDAAYALGSLVGALIAGRRYEDALQVCERHVRLEERHGRGTTSHFVALSQFGRCLVEARMFNEATAILQQALLIAEVKAGGRQNRYETEVRGLLARAKAGGASG
jgi:tetratricopeptide (TPR) repeat protein